MISHNKKAVLGRGQPPGPAFENEKSNKEVVDVDFQQNVRGSIAIH